MRRLREILNNSFVGRFFVHVFILNFFTCQCLATIPQRVIAENFRNNLDVLFSEFDESREKLSLSLNRTGAAQFELSITKTDLYAKQEEKKFTGSVETDTNGTEFVQFHLAENAGPVIFYLYNGVCNLSYLDSRISLFETKDRLQINDLHTLSMLQISAPELTIGRTLQSDFGLNLTCSNIINNGTILAPSLRMHADDITSCGSILGADIDVHAANITFAKGSIVVSKNNLQLDANGAVSIESASVQCKNLTANISELNIGSRSNLRVSGFCNIQSNTFLNLDSELTLSDLLLATNTFFNSGSIASQTIDIGINKQEIIHPSLNKVLSKYDDFIPVDKRFGTFANIGSISSKEFTLKAEKYVLNMGIIEVDNALAISSISDLINDGSILQKNRNHRTSEIRTYRLNNRNGRIEFSHDLLVESRELCNQQGLVKARKLDIKLALDEDSQFAENEKEKTLLHVEKNEMSAQYRRYGEVFRNFKKTPSEQDNEEGKQDEPKDSNASSEEKQNIPNFGFIDNNGGRVESETLGIKGSGPIFNGDAGAIVAKTKMSIDVYGRIINQFGGVIDSPEINIRSDGSIFNTLGASINSANLHINSDGFVNGLGSRMRGAFVVNSKRDFTNNGEIISLANSIINTDCMLYNAGSLLPSDAITITAQDLQNFGRFSAVGNANLNIKGILNNDKSALLESEEGSIVISDNVKFCNSGRIRSNDLDLTRIASYEVSGNEGILDIVRKLSMRISTPLRLLNTTIKADDLEVTFTSEQDVDIGALLHGFRFIGNSVTIDARNSVIKNKTDLSINYDLSIFSKEFHNLAVLRNEKNTTIRSMIRLRNGVIVPNIYFLEDDDDLKSNENFDVSNIYVQYSDKKANTKAIISAKLLNLLSDGSIMNTGSLFGEQIQMRANSIHHGWAYEERRTERLPDFSFDYDFMVGHDSRIEASRELNMHASEFTNLLGIMTSQSLNANVNKLFLNYGGDITVFGDAIINSDAFVNTLGAVQTNQKEIRVWSLEYFNTASPSLSVINGKLNINSPYVLNRGGRLYAHNGVYLQGNRSALRPAIVDISNAGVKYTRMYSVNEFNKHKYADKILGLGLASTGMGAIIRAELNETVQHSVIPASLSSAGKVAIKRYDKLKSGGVIHSKNIEIEIGQGGIELGYTGDAILPHIPNFAKRIETYPYISSLTDSEIFDLGTDDFFFKSVSDGMRLPITIIGNYSQDLKLPFSLEVLNVMLLKQTQRALGTGYLSDMPTMLDAAQKAYDPASVIDQSAFIFLKNYTDNPISLVSEENAKIGLFFKVQKLGGHDLLFPELRISSESVHSALKNPAGAIVAQGQDANVIIDTEGFLHATSALHADDDIKIKAGRGALFETMTYDAMGITQNVTVTSSRGFCGVGRRKTYHKISEWHKIKRAKEPMLATTTRGDFIVVLPDDEETAEFKGMFADIAGNFEVHGGNCVLSPLELATVVECPKIPGNSANRISTLLPVFMKTVLKSKGDFLADVRVFKNSGSRIEALGDVFINASETLEFNTDTKKFTLAEGMNADSGIFATKTSHRKFEDVVFDHPEVKAQNIKFNADEIHLTGRFESAEDIEMHARLAELESALGYGSDEFTSNASSMFSNASYSRFVTFARISPTVFKAHGDFITDILDVYMEHSVQRHVRNEKIIASKINSLPLQAHEEIIETSSSSGFNFFAPTAVVAPVCDGNIRQAIDAFWRESSLLSSAYGFLHSKSGAEIAANGISTALAAYDSIKTVLDYGSGSIVSSFGFGNFGFYHTESRQHTTHDFTVGSETVAKDSIEWRATTGDINIAHRVAKANGDQVYTAAGRIIVNPGEDKTEIRSKTSSITGSFNVFTMNASIGVGGGESLSESIDYRPSQFHSGGTNVFRVGDGIELVIPQIVGTGNVFDSVLILLENKANEREVHSESHGVTISTNLAKTVSKTLGLNAGRSDSHDTLLNDAYIRGAVDFMHSQVRNQGCLAMNITNKGASYEYVPGHKVHDSKSFAIGLSGLNLSSADAFAYSLGRNIASAAASAGVGMLASKAGLGGFVSTIAASLAGTYVNTEVLPQKSVLQKMPPRDQKSKLPNITSNSTVSFEHNGRGFSAVNLDFDKAEFEAVINKNKENVFAEALDAGASPQEVVEVIQQEVKEVEKDVVEFREKAKEVRKKAEEAKREQAAPIAERAENDAIQDAIIDLLLAQPSVEEYSILDRQIWDCFNESLYSIEDASPREQMKAFEPKNKAEAALKEATLLRYKLEDLVAKHPEAAEICSKMFVGAMYGLQGIEYAVSGFVAGPVGILAKFAAQESTAWAIDTTVEESSNQAAKLITQAETLQREFAGTIKFCTYAGLCAGSIKAGKKLIDSLSKSTVERTTFNLTRYGGPGGGHHVHMKSAYKSHPLYDSNEALCLSREEMTRLGIDHDLVSKTQRTLCESLKKTGNPMTREEMNKISVQSLIAGGADEQLARDIVAKSQWNLRVKGIRHPSDVPWGKKGKGTK